jgi:hypothetical protein
MQSVYTKPLLVIFLLLLLAVGLLIIQRYTKKHLQENFISDDIYNSQIKFINTQIEKAMIGDAAVDTPHLPNPEDLKNATQDIDLFAKRERPKTEHWYTNVMDSEVMKKEMQCRAMELPEDLPDDNIKQRIDCTWMYSPTGKSGATLATIAGPVFGISRRKYPTGQFDMIWSKGEAVKKEKIKVCALTKKCSLLVPGKNCGFCPEFGNAVPVDLNGNSLYNEARCPAKPVMNPDDCMKPRSEGGGGYFINACVPDASGNLTKTCLTDLAEMAGCSDKGTILQALKDSSVPTIATQGVRDVVDVMRSYSFNLPVNLFSDGGVTVNTALNTYVSISRASQTSKNGRVQKASGNLCYGSPFSPCDYEENSQENFNLRCLQDLYQSVGCQGRGSEFPTQDNINKFYGKTWGSIKKSVNLMSDMMTNTKGTYTADQQKDALQRCIGTHLRKRATTYCNELGISVFMYYGSPNGTFFGRKIITNMFFSLRPDSTFWDLLDVFNSPLTGGNRVYLVIKTNFNPDQAGVQSYIRYGNFNDVIKWNDKPMISKNGSGISQDPLNGLVLKQNSQQDQRLEIDIVVDYQQYNQRDGMWYMTDNAGNQPLINMCRLPIERKNPLMNIVMNEGDVVEATGNVGIQPTNCTPGTLGGQSCTVFNGNTWIRIGNGLRNRAFRSYTMKVWCNTLENRDAFFSFYNGKWEQQNEIWFWIVIPLGLFIWIPIPIFHMVWKYYPDNWWKSGSRTELSTGPRNDTLQALEKPNYDGGLSINAEQSGIIQPKTWQHFTWIWTADYSAVDIYVDGVKRISGSGTSTPEQITNENYIGRSVVDNDHRLHRGGMQWFRGFDYPLTADEIQQDMDDDW